jgi:pimeloyl-ACP methyl ester carboxylesterase
MRWLAALLAGTLWLGAQSPSFEGTWLGAIDTGVQGKLRLQLNVTRNADGSLQATFDSLDQGARGIPVTHAEAEGRTFRFRIGNAISYTGILSEDGARIQGTFKQVVELPLVLTRVDKPVVLRRPQEPARPYPYNEEEVSFENKAAQGVVLAGTLTTPPGAGPHPAVVLITGSGPQDRDESLMGHKPFLVLADHLTRAGIAVLRYDDRGAGKSKGDFSSATSEDFASDAAAALAFLKSRPGIDGARVGLLGHSEGGLIAPMVAVRNGGVAFLVMLAGPGVAGEQILYEQGQAILRAQGAPEDARRQQLEVQKRMFAVIREEKDPSAAEKKLLAALPLQDPAAERQIKAANTPWMRFFLFYEPAETLAKVKVPVLALFGELDLQVLPSQNLPAVAAALERARNADFAVVKLPRLNHLFQTATTGAVSEYGQIEETMSPRALETISSWILARVRK